MNVTENTTHPPRNCRRYAARLTICQCNAKPAADVHATVHSEQWLTGGCPQTPPQRTATHELRHTNTSAHCTPGWMIDLRLTYYDKIYMLFRPNRKARPERHRTICMRNVSTPPPARPIEMYGQSVHMPATCAHTHNHGHPLQCRRRWASRAHSCTHKCKPHTGAGNNYPVRP